MLRFNREFYRYCAVSACALLVDAGLLTLLVQVFAIHYLLAAILSFCAGALVAYFLCVNLVFKYRRLHNGLTEFAAFSIIGAAGLALNVAVIYILVGRFQLHFLAAKAAAASFTFLCNFLLRRLLLFTPWNSAVPTTSVKAPLQ